MTTTDLPTKIVESAEDAGVSGAQSIKRVKGILTSLLVKDSRFKDKAGNVPQQMEVTLNNAEILGRFPNSIGEVELKDDKFVTWIKYSKQKGAPPHASSPYMRNWVGSAKKVYGKPPTELIGQLVTIENTEMKFENDEGKEVKFKFWTFVTDEKETDIKDYMRSIIVGLKTSAVMRPCMMDVRAKQHPEYGTAAANGTLAELLGLKIVDDIYVLQ